MKILLVGNEEPCVGGIVAFLKKMKKVLDKNNYEYLVYNTCFLEKYIKNSIKIIFDYPKFLKRNEDIEVIIITHSLLKGFLLYYYISIVSIIKKKKVILRFGSSNMRDIFNNPIKRNILKLFLKPFNNIIVQSEYWKNSFNTIFNGNIFIIPNWVENGVIDKNYVNCKDMKKITFISGHQYIRKGVNTIISDIEKYQEYYRNKGFHFYCINTVDEVKNEIIQRGLTDLVTFIHKLDRIDFISELSTSYIFLAPSFSEGFPNSVVESVALDNIVITSDIPEIFHSFSNYKGVLFVNQKKSINETIKNILEANYEEMVECNKKMVKSSYSENRVTSIIIRMLENAE